MVTTQPEKKALMAQRRTRRLRRQRQPSAINLPNGNSAAEKPKKTLLVSDLGWTPEYALANHYRYKIFEEDWNAPGMELYDDV